jgi:hypothetical protein
MVRRPAWAFGVRKGIRSAVPRTINGIPVRPVYLKSPVRLIMLRWRLGWDADFEWFFTYYPITGDMMEAAKENELRI